MSKIEELLAKYNGNLFDAIDNRNDLMDLYEQIEKDGKWIEFEAEIYERVFIPYYYKEAKAINNFNAWLFCLDGKGYEDRCKMVAEFYGWKGEK